MALVSVANACFDYGDRRVLDGVNLTLDQGQHVGLVGRNGCGKSTLLKLIATAGGVAEFSDLKLTDGQIQLARGATAGYLHQDHNLDPDKTLLEQAKSAFAASDDVQREMEAVAEQMGDPAVYDDPKKLEQVMARYAELEERLASSGGYATDHLVEETLHGLGLEDEFFGVRCADLSGGQRGRLALAELLLQQPDVLLLDEPTNHLDIAGRQWLERFLTDYRGAVLLISHDRWLLDRVASKIYELELGGMVEYPGNYAKFRELRHTRVLEQRRAYEKQQTQIKSEKQFIAKFKAGQRAKQARGRETRLKRFIRDHAIEPPQELDTVKLTFNPRTRSGDTVIDAEELTQIYDGVSLFEGLTMQVKRGQRIGVIGPNGAGKSTLIRCMLGAQQPAAGHARLGSQVSVGHFTQTHEHLDLNQTVVEYLAKFVPSGTEQEACDLAGAFLFSGDDQDKQLAVMSGGERARAVLAGLMAGGHNLLVLDEPTNHLDIPSAERLEEALRRYTTASKKYSTGVNQGGAEGTLLLITHDRMLLEELVDELIVFDGRGGVEHFLGGYADYLRDRGDPAAAADDAAVAVRKAKTKPKRKVEPSKTKKVAPAGSGKTQRSGRGEVGKLSREKLEAEIEWLEARIQEIDFSMQDPSVYEDGGRVSSLKKEREAAQSRLVPLNEEWMAR